MPYSLQNVFDLIGTIAFAISGAMLGIRKDMDAFGVLMLAVVTACGGGLTRDLVIGNTPPRMFVDPFHVEIAAVCGLAVFILLYFHRKLPRMLAKAWDETIFWFDTFGLASFTVDGVMIGLEAGFSENAFLLVFLGFITGVGGGVIRDVLANKLPDIFVKRVYACAAIAGGVAMTCLLRRASMQIAMTAGFVTVLVVRILARHYEWDFPKVAHTASDR